MLDRYVDGERDMLCGVGSFVAGNLAKERWR